MADPEFPKEPGFYWARSCKYEWWNLLLHCMGDPPYLKCYAWDHGTQKVFKMEDLSYTGWVLGPKIEEPPKRAK